MKPEEVPAELVEPGRNAMIKHLRAAAAGPGIPTFEEKVRVVLAACLPEHERQVRAKVAEEILADVAALFAARVGADLWEAAFHSAKVARGEGS